MMVEQKLNLCFIYRLIMVIMELIVSSSEVETKNDLI
jgi:hypothetical protein